MGISVTSEDLRTQDLRVFCNLDLSAQKRRTEAQEEIQLAGQISHKCRNVSPSLESIPESKTTDVINRILAGASYMRENTARILGWSRLSLMPLEMCNASRTRKITIQITTYE